MSDENRERQLPGAELVAQGVAELSQNRQTECSFLLLIAAPRLRRLGIQIPGQSWPEPEHQLYALLEQRLGSAAHSHYNSLIRRIVSYARALEREESAASRAKR